jgi:hypothetical protein
MVTNKSGLRKLKLHVQMSIDGCIAGPNGEMDWMVGPFNPNISIDFTWG